MSTTVTAAKRAHFSAVLRASAGLWNHEKRRAFCMASSHQNNVQRNITSAATHSETRPSPTKGEVKIFSIEKVQPGDSIPSEARVEGTLVSKPAPGIDFGTALSNKSTFELVRALAIFQLCTIPVFVSNSRRMYDVARNLLGQRIADMFVKNTFFGHFCGGETEQDLAPLIKRLQSQGIGSILDYAAETEIEEAAHARADDMSEYEANTTNLILSITSCARVKTSPNDESFAAMKVIQIFLSKHANIRSLSYLQVTGLAEPKLLLDSSSAIDSIVDGFTKLDAAGSNHLTLESLRAGLTRCGVTMDNAESEQLFTQIDTDRDGKFSRSHFLDFLCPTREGSGIYYDRLAGPLLAPFGAHQRKALHEAARRVERVAQHAENCNVTVMVDAEQTFLQPAIDRLTLRAMRRHNRNKAVVFNTYQCYLRDSLGRVLDDLERSQRDGFVFGAKIVRGAYMIQERKWAEEKGKPDPIHADIEATHRNYHAVLDAILLHKLQCRGGTAVLVATHNEDSITYTLSRLQELSIPVNSGVFFAQLLGMRDHLSMALGKQGYRVYKYVPYGPVREVLPYLLRRAEENSDVLSGVQQDRAIHRAELRRRLRTALGAPPPPAAAAPTAAAPTAAAGARASAAL